MASQIKFKRFISHASHFYKLNSSEIKYEGIYTHIDAKLSSMSGYCISKNVEIKTRNELVPINCLILVWIY